MFKLLEHKVNLWNTQVFNTLKKEDMHCEHYVENMFQTYVDILECYGIQQSCTQHFVSSFSFLRVKVKKKNEKI